MRNDDGGKPPVPFPPPCRDRDFPLARSYLGRRARPRSARESRGCAGWTRITREESRLSNPRRLSSPLLSFSIASHRRDSSRRRGGRGRGTSRCIVFGRMTLSRPLRALPDVSLSFFLFFFFFFSVGVLRREEVESRSLSES